MPRSRSEELAGYDRTIKVDAPRSLLFTEAKDLSPERR